MNTNYACFLCESKFNNEKFAISHLKLNHFIRDNTIEIKCLLNCNEVFLKFDKLRKHLKKCANSQVLSFQNVDCATLVAGSDNEVLSFEIGRNHTTQLCFVFIPAT